MPCQTALSRPTRITACARFVWVLAILILAVFIKFQPMPLSRRAQPFNDPEWVFEIKHDGFRALAYVKAGQCQLVSRKGYVYKRFVALAEQIAQSLKARDAVLDGEIVCLDGSGKSQFKSLMYRRGTPYFYAFDILQLNGKDLRSLPLLTRKRQLRRLIPKTGPLCCTCLTSKNAERICSGWPA
jgi:ATP-dependent DNA ligase